MKKRYLTLILAGAALSMVFSACGNKETAETTAAETTAAGESTGSTETEAVSSEDPEIAALENMEVPAVPKLQDMGTIVLPDFSQIEVTEAEKVEVTDEMVESQINYYLSLTLEEVDGAAQEGDIVNIDYVGTMDGVAFDGGTAEGYDLTLGSGTFIEGFEDQLIGAKAGDEVTVSVTFPENYSSEELAGKPAEFAVTVHVVKRSPELTDAWVENYEETDAKTAEEFWDETRRMLEGNYDYSYHSAIQSSALMAVVDAAEITLSDTMKEYATAYVINTQATQMAQYGFSIADMINMYGMTAEEFKEEMAAEGEEYAKQYFVIQQVAADQNIKLTDALMDELAESISKMTGRSYNRIMLIEQFGKDLVESEAVNSAVMNYLESQVKLVPEEAAEETKAE